MPGKHTLTFECDIFTEKFIEYCFVYVSQAITGAMAEVKLSCIPTFPLQGQKYSRIKQLRIVTRSFSCVNICFFDA